MKRPFWMHQLVEYLLGGAVVASGLQSPTPAVPSVVGAVLMLHAAITIGPLAAFRVLPRRIHRITDLVLIALTAAAAAQPWIRCESGSRMILGMIAAVHGFVWWRTNFTEPLTRRQRALPLARRRGPPRRGTSPTTGRRTSDGWPGGWPGAGCAPPRRPRPPATSSDSVSPCRSSHPPQT
ncbi:MAG: hypothetical protein V9E89_04865 [Ilumatobacteraceae bacterium]